MSKDKKKNRSSYTWAILLLVVILIALLSALIEFGVGSNPDDVGDIAVMIGVLIPFVIVMIAIASIGNVMKRSYM